MPKRTLSNYERPWLNKDGSLKSDSEITRLGKTWSQEIWTRYLDTTVEPREEKKLAFFPYIDTGTMATKPQISDFLSCGEDFDSDMKFVLQKAIKDLSKREKQVVKGIFWKGKSPVVLAKELKINPSTVYTLKSTALVKLQKMLSSEVCLWKLNREKKGKTRLSA